MYELLGRKSDVPDSLLECTSIYEQGLTLYHSKAYAPAAEKFRTSADLERYSPLASPLNVTNPSLEMMKRAVRGIKGS